MPILLSNSSLCGLEDNTTKVNERCLPFKIGKPKLYKLYSI